MSDAKAPVESSASRIGKWKSRVGKSDRRFLRPVLEEAVDGGRSWATPVRCPDTHHPRDIPIAAPNPQNLILPVHLYSKLELARIVGCRGLAGVGKERAYGGNVVHVGDVEHVSNEIHA